MYWIAFGDIHESPAMAREIPDLAQADGVIVTGDLTNRGSREAARSVIETIAGINPHIMALLGNMDTDTVQTYLTENNMDLHLKVRELAPGLALMGVGMSAPTPFGTPSEIDEPTLVKWLDTTHELASGYDHIICAIHEPPHGTALDRIDNGMHVGSRGVRAFIEKAQPDVAVFGHIHESVGSDTIGKTPAFNPGMLSGGNYVRIDFDGKEVTAQLKSV